MSIFYSKKPLKCKYLHTLKMMPLTHRFCTLIEQNSCKSKAKKSTRFSNYHLSVVRFIHFVVAITSDFSHLFKNWEFKFMWYVLRYISLYFESKYSSTIKYVLQSYMIQSQRKQAFKVRNDEMQIFCSWEYKYPLTCE